MARTAHNHPDRHIIGGRRFMTLPFWLALALAVSNLVAPRARAAGLEIGPDCRIVVSAPASGGPVAGYRLYYGPTPGARALSIDLAAATETTCSAAGIPEGQVYIVARAYNAAGEGPDSTEIPFVLVKTLPGAPGLQILPPTP